jgi:hypothetical protein
MKELFNTIKYLRETIPEVYGLSKRKATAKEGPYFTVECALSKWLENPLKRVPPEPSIPCCGE